MPYPLERSEAELRWYRDQAAFYEPWTTAILSEVGVESNMTALDVGSGAGDVSFLLARMVGPKGRVLGIDSNPDAVCSASVRASAASLGNVEFRIADIRDTGLDEQFDIVFGRFVLMYQQNPASVLINLKRGVRAGGRIAFIEPDYSGARSLETLPLFKDVLDKVERTMQMAGADTRMGLRLYRTFCDAGLPEPELRLSAVVGGGNNFGGYEVATAFLGLLLPAMERFGIATRLQISPETLADRLRSEVLSSGGVIVMPSVVAAWTGVM
jgi:ubiquinone/menaquinone biosynthesis C-methylase UbiE